jgi:TIR domain-containing protein
MPTMPVKGRDQVFISYSHEDDKWCRLLLKVLAPLPKQTLWWDGFIEAGQKWREEIHRALDSARVAVLLVSPNFLASEFVMKEELPNVLDAAEREGVRVLWCMVRKCWYEATRLKDYQGAHDPKKAWNALSETELDELLVEVAKKIQKAQDVEPAPSPREEKASAVVSPAGPTEKSASDDEAEVVVARPEPRGVTEASLAAEIDSGHQHAERLLTDVRDPRVVDEIGNLFVLRNRWYDARFTYDRLIDLAAPYGERWMAQGYEKLGVVHQRLSQPGRATQCWKLAKILYRRIGEGERADEVLRRLQEISMASADGPLTAAR